MKTLLDKTGRVFFFSEDLLTSHRPLIDLFGDQLTGMNWSKILLRIELIKDKFSSKR
jgi:hypothetical protein